MDVQVDSRQSPTYVVITLQWSKIDIFGVKCTMYIGGTHSMICPLNALLAYLAIRPMSPGPLCVHANGSPVTRSSLVSAVYAALSGAGMALFHYICHSFRIGAATSATQAGLPNPLIQTRGCWRSAAFQWYTRTPTNTILSISHTLVHARAMQRGQTDSGYNTA